MKTEQVFWLDSQKLLARYSAFQTLKPPVDHEAELIRLERLGRENQTSGRTTTQDVFDSERYYRHSNIALRQ